MSTSELEPNRPEHAFVCEKPSIQLSEFDLGGVLYHANYFHLYENAREEFLRQQGCSYSSLVEQGTHLAVTESWQKFDKPIFYGEPVRIYLWTEELRRATVRFCYEIVKSISGGEEIIHRAWTKQVFVAVSDGQFKTSRFPEKLIDIFQTLLSIR